MDISGTELLSTRHSHTISLIPTTQQLRRNKRRRELEWQRAAEVMRYSHLFGDLLPAPAPSSLTVECMRYSHLFGDLLPAPVTSSLTVECMGVCAGAGK